VMGEVLLSAPARARRVISDQILALDLTSLMDRAETVEEVSSLLSESARQFGFLAVELSGEGTDHRELRHDPIILQNWAWKLDYPIRIDEQSPKPEYVLSIWCSPEFSTRPYGAERVARILGPALRAWFENGGRHVERHAALRGASRRSLLKRARSPFAPKENLP